MATKALMSLEITNPSGESRTILVPPSLQIRLEQKHRQPLLAQSLEGFIGSAALIAYEVGLDDGFIPKTVSFTEFVDADPGWEISLVDPGTQIPTAIDPDSPADAEGE